MTSTAWLWGAVGAVLTLGTILFDVIKWSVERSDKRKELLRQERAQEQAEEAAKMSQVTGRWRMAQKSIEYVKNNCANFTGFDEVNALDLGLGVGGAHLRTVFALWKEVARLPTPLSIQLDPGLKDDCVACWKCLKTLVETKRTMNDPDFAVGFESFAKSCGDKEYDRR